MAQDQDSATTLSQHLNTRILGHTYASSGRNGRNGV